MKPKTQENSGMMLYARSKASIFRNKLSEVVTLVCSFTSGHVSFPLIRYTKGTALVPIILPEELENMVMYSL